jgi:putative ABC transport system permease protein
LAATPVILARFRRRGQSKDLLVVPIKYNLRNLRVRWGTTIRTSVATGLMVCAAVFVFGLIDGLAHAFKVSSDPLKLVVLRKGSEDETGSQVEGRLARELKTLAGIAADDQGRPLCSAENVTILTKPRRGDTVPVNLTVRGLTEIGRNLRPGFRIVAGRDLVPGKFEAVTSRSIAQRFQNCGLGEKLDINGAPFEIVGLFQANGGVAESEVWTDVRDLLAARKLPEEFMTSVIVRAQDQSARTALIDRIERDPQFNLEVKDEREYYQTQLAWVRAIRWIGYGLAAVLGIGAMFGAANTMYAAVASRAREIATLRTLGFSRGSILVSFLIESTILCLAGGLLGCLGTLPFHGMSSGTMNQTTFSEVTFSFQFGPRVLFAGAAMAFLMGLLGGLFPAVRAVRMNIIQALREV